MKKTKKFNVMLLITMLVTFLTITTCYADSKNKTSVVYNTKDLGINTMNKDGSIYIPIRAFSENLYYKVLWDSSTQTVRIYDNLSDIYLNMNGDVKVNNVASKSEKVPVLVNGSVYVPLRFVSENLGIDVNYDAKNSKVNMTGRDIYEISQKDPTKPYLIAYTKDGRKQVCLISDKVNYETETFLKVVRTKHSDIIKTTYVQLGALTTSVDNQIYVKDGKMIDKSNRFTNAYITDSGKETDTIYCDDRVALLDFGDNDKSYVKVYNDITGELITKIDTKELYNKNTTYHGYDKYKDNYGKVHNIQAVGKDFVVVSMYQPFEYAKDDHMAYDTLYCYTTVINLETLEMYPVYKNLNYFKEYSDLGREASGILLFGGVSDVEMARGISISYGIVPDDCEYFDGIQKDGTLRFVGYYTKNGVKEHEWCTVNYKK